MKNKNNKKTHVVAGRQNWHFRVVDEIIRRQLWVSPKKTCAVIKILEISRRVVWEVVNLKFASPTLIQCRDFVNCNVTINSGEKTNMNIFKKY